MIDQSSLLYKSTFILLGVCSLLGWNADEKSTDLGEQVSFLFPIPLLFANFFWGPFMPYISTLVTPKARVVWGLIIISILLIFLPILAIFLNNTIGFGLSMLVTFLLGTLNSITQNTMIALATQTGGNLMNLFWISTGISGFVMNTCQFVATLSFGASNDDQLMKGTVFYYGLAIAINFVCIFMYLKMIADPGFESQLELNINKQDNLLDTEISNYSHDISVASEDDYSQKKQLSTVSMVMLKIKLGFKAEGYIIPFFIWLIYAQTFTMYPAVTLKKNPFQYKILNDDGWGILALFTLYNCGDIIGKSIGGIKQTVNQNLHVIAVLIRFCFFVIYILIATDKSSSFFQNDWVAFLNTLFFAIFNGFSTTGFMILGSMKSQKPKELEIIGFINSFMLTFGISSGTFIALGFKNL